MSEHTRHPDAGSITFINVFEIPAEQVDAFIESWVERAGIMSTYPGFRDTRLHRALSPDGRFQLINVAHWDSPEEYAAAHADSEFQVRIRAVAQDQRVVPNPQLYRVVAGYVLPQGAQEPVPVGQVSGMQRTSGEAPAT